MSTAVYSPTPKFVYQTYSLIYLWWGAWRWSWQSIWFIEYVMLNMVLSWNLKRLTSLPLIFAVIFFILVSSFLLHNTFCFFSDGNVQRKEVWPQQTQETDDRILHLSGRFPHKNEESWCWPQRNSQTRSVDMLWPLHDVLAGFVRSLTWRIFGVRFTSLYICHAVLRFPTHTLTFSVCPLQVLLTIKYYHIIIFHAS